MFTMFDSNWLASECESMFEGKLECAICSNRFADTLVGVMWTGLCVYLDFKTWFLVKQERRGKLKFGLFCKRPEAI